MEGMQWGANSVLFLLIAVVGFFLEREIRSNGKKHEQHFHHAMDLNLHETERERVALKEERRLVAAEVIRHGELVAAELVRHGEADDKRFTRIETSLDGIRNDIKDILIAVKK